MAKGKTGGRNFKAGESGNPGGRPALPDDLKAARALNRVELERILNKFLFMTVEEIKASVKLTSISAFELMVASIVVKGVELADTNRVSFLLDRLGFVVTKKVDMSANHNTTFKIEFTDEQKRKIAKAYLDDE